MASADHRKLSALGPPLRSDDALVRMLHIQGRIVWHGIEATDRDARKAGVHLLVPVSTGLVVLHGPSGRKIDLPFGHFRNLRARSLNGTIEMEVRNDKGTWRKVRWSTTRRDAKRFVDAMGELERTYT
jgi:hypothetical protein